MSADDHIRKMLDAGAPEFTDAEAVNVMLGQLERVLAECRAAGHDPERTFMGVTLHMSLPFVNRVHRELSKARPTG